jgi:hypothetical protein
LEKSKSDLAVKQLILMNKFKTPKDKITLMMNFSKVVGLMLKETSPDGQDGADIVFPVFLYLIISSNPPSFLLNVVYIDLY